MIAGETMIFGVVGGGRFRVETRLGALVFETVDDAAGFVASQVRMRLNAFVAVLDAHEDDIDRYSGDKAEEPEVAF
jgi:hypothetical protein